MSVRMGDGPPTARVMIVGEAWGENEERTGIPFSGASGMELNKMLHEVGIMRAECYTTNVINARPPSNKLLAWIPETKKAITPDMVQVRDRFVKPIVAEGFASLKREIGLIKPKVIIALGNTALWALTGHSGVVKWRGSLLSTDLTDPPTRVVPTYHPAAILRMYEWRAIGILDLRRAKREFENPVATPAWNFVIRPNLDGVLEVLHNLQLIVENGPIWIDLDLETAAGHIKCCGLSWSRVNGLCIPFMTEGNWRGYWLPEEEAQILFQLYKLLTHPNCWVRGQNLLYDCQYTYRHWHFIPNVKQDTMISHHTLWAGLANNLAFQASMYCDYYVNWKPDKQSWKEGG